MVARDTPGRRGGAPVAVVAMVMMALWAPPGHAQGPTPAPLPSPPAESEPAAPPTLDAPAAAFEAGFETPDLPLRMMRFDDRVGPPRPARIRAVRFADGRPLRPADRAAVSAALDRNPTDAVLDGVVTALEARGHTGLDLTVQPTTDPGLVDVVVSPDGSALRVGRLRITAIDGLADTAADRRLRRRIEGVTAPLALDEGQVFHPWFEARDTRRVERYFIDQGHPFVQVEPRRAESPGVVDITWRVQPGPKVAVEEVQITGLPGGIAPPTMGTEAGQPARPWVVRADAEVLRGATCRAGHPEAEVRTRAGASRAGVGIAFEIEPGRTVPLAGLEVEGDGLPPEVLDPPLALTGTGFCPDAADDVVAELRRRLEAAARPGARVSWRTEAHGSGIDAVKVVVEVSDARAVRIDRVWFSGNHVTRLDLLRFLISVEEGQPYDPFTIAESVQTLRRSGLFRRVEVHAVAGSAPDTRHLVFTVVEREPFSIDLQQQSLTLHNLDFSDATTDVVALRAGAALRGAGQRLKLYAQPEWQGLHVFDPYVLPLLGVEARLDRRTSSFGAGVEETWYSLEMAGGLRLLDGRLRLLGAVQYELTFPEGVTSGAGIPVADAVTLYGAPGLRLQARFEQLDSERVAYLGLRFSGHAWRALAALGSDIELTRMGAEIDARVPLHRLRGERHLVLGLTFGVESITRHDRGEVPAHTRISPKIRGYQRLRFDHIIGGDDVLSIGGRTAFTAAAEVRVPMPYARRHALIPFLDGAALGDEKRDALDNLFFAPGLTYAYSFFDERLEGFLQVAFPLRTDVELAYLAFGMDGSF